MKNKEFTGSINFFNFFWLTESFTFLLFSFLLFYFFLSLHQIFKKIVSIWLSMPNFVGENVG